MVAIQPKLLVLLLRANLAVAITIHNCYQKMRPEAKK